MQDRTSCCGPAAPKSSTSAPTSPPTRASAPRFSDDAVWIAGGRSFVGTTRPLMAGDGEGPRRPVRLNPYGIGRHAVSNRQFARFVDATGHVTEAERFGWSFVFRSFVSADVLRTSRAAPGLSWWLGVDGADWRHPEGPGSTVEGREDHPVVHVSWNDAVAFAGWAGARLPTEVEWEHAARAGTERTYPWGDEEPEDAPHPRLNIWQGQFPTHNLGTDGFLGTAPVSSYAPNPFGLYNMAGNVWEWCADRFRVRSLSSAAKRRDAEAIAEDERTMKGGSYLCHRSYCHRYRIAGRTGRAPDSSAGHVGFRLAYDPLHTA